MDRPRPPLFALPLATWERDGIKAALARAGLPADDVETDGPLFWRFERDDVPVGFAGIEVHGSDAVLRSLLTLPPLRQQGIGGANDDREVVSFDGRVMVLRYVDPEVAGRYGTGVYVRCAPRA